MSHRLVRSVIIAVGLLLGAPATGSGPERDEAAVTPAPQAGPRASVTRSQVRIGGTTVHYSATAGWLVLERDGAAVARFGFTAYTREGVESPARRPIMFAFNGGPGSSSIWLHMGILGPRRVVVSDEGFTPPPPVETVDNEFSILDVSDLVMVDPVGTGFSRPLGEATGKNFWGVDQDIESVAAFITKYVTENGRWNSPKYLLGESYGGMRAAGLVHHLQSRHGMNFNGVVLVSPFLSMGSGVDGAHIDLPHVLYLPTLAATAWYHGLVPGRPADLRIFLEEVERFAYEEYAPALLRGHVLPEETRRVMAEKLARFTGTTAEFWERAGLRVSHTQFLQELLREQRQVTGRIDSRFLGPGMNPLAETMEYDPFFPAVGPAFTAAFLDYMHTELGFGRDEEYIVTARGLEWDWKHRPPSSRGWVTPFANTGPDLAAAMVANPGLHVLVQQGWYDLATPHLATRHDLDHLRLPPTARSRIRIESYEAGHMMYLHGPSMVKFKDDLAGFVRASSRLE